MKYGFFDSSEFESKDGAKSPFGESVVRPELIQLLNRIRGRYGKPVVVNSAYRSPTHNASVGGADNSFHVKGLAADIRPLAKNADDLCELQDICLTINTNGGVGLYDTFVHVDARGARARWDERKFGD